MRYTRTTLPARTVIVALLVLLAVSGCGSKQAGQDRELAVEPAKRPISEIVKPDVVYAIDVYDPWEGFNRRMYIFNYYFDKYVYLPVVNVYEAVLPDFVEDRVTDFFKNIGELKNLLNSILQLKGPSTVKTTGRILVNTTIGLAGLFDPATSMGIIRQHEDFGQTLGHYGVGNGPYLVLPVLGPSNLRDTTGLIVDTAARTALYDEIDPFENAQDKDAIEAGIMALEAIDKRRTESFRYYRTGSPFEYDLVRLLYQKKRQLDIAK